MKAVAYCRYSSNNQREESIEGQLRAIQDYCTKENITLIDTYVDQAKSATSDNRPRFIDMIHDSANGMFDIVLVHKLDRFARNRYDSAFYRKKLKDNGVKLISVLEQFDDSPESIILESVLEGMSEYYSKNLAREVKKGMKENAVKGVHNGGIPLLGYDVINGQYVINESEAIIIRKIFKLYLCDYGYYSIADILNKEGYKSKRGNEFQTITIKAILRNVRYTGLYKFDEIEIENHFPAIIDKEIFEEANLKAQSKRPKPRQVENEKYLLTGFVKCGICGASYIGGGYGFVSGKKVYKYTCYSRQKNSTSCTNALIHKVNLEETILNAIQENFLTDSAIDLISNQIALKIENSRNSDNSNVKKLMKDKKDLETRLNKLFDLYLDDKINKDMISSKSDEIRKSIDHLEYEISQHEFKNKPFSKETIKNYLIENRYKLNDKSEYLKRQLVESFIEKIVIYHNKVTIYAKLSGNITNGSPMYSLTLEYYRVGGKIKSPV